MKGLEKTASLAEVFSFIETNSVATVLFVDQTKLCSTYCNFSWVAEQAAVVEVDQEIVDTLQIGKVPQFRFFLNGNEVGAVIGTVEFTDFAEERDRVFGNLKSLKRS